MKRKKIEIHGLENEGPGDIVGAIASKTPVSGDEIGEIELEDQRARVELPEKYIKDVASTMDDNRIGASRVSVRIIEESPFPTSVEGTDDYIARWDELVEMERRQEMREHEREIKQLSGPEREEKGRAFLSMRGRGEGEGISGHLVKFMKNRKGTPLPETEISVGDLIMISKQDPLRDDNPTGTVVEQTNYSITASFQDKPPSFVYGKNLRIDLYVNDITYQRMKDALRKLDGATGRLRKLRDVIVGTQTPSGMNRANVDFWFNYDLNDSQKDAVRAALGTDEFFLIHGPPGTGKTTTAIEVIQQYVQAGKSVLATAASNTAVDNLLEFLIEQNVNAVRAGHPARVTPTLKEHTLDYRIQENSTYRRAKKLREEAFETKDKQDDLTHPSGRWRRGMSNEQIQELAAEERGYRGVPPEKIKEMAEWISLQNQADDLFRSSDELEQEAINQILDNAEVVCTTNSTSGSRLLENRTFDVVVIDEATQATEPSCLIPITHAKKVIMAGDHHQLPPTIKNFDAARSGLNRTLFEKLAERHGDRIKKMLNLQYRMHRDIMKFSSKQFYESRLNADESVKFHTLSDPDLDVDLSSAEHKKILDPSIPLVFVNTKDVQASERKREGSTSTENPFEAELVSNLARELLNGGLPPEELAIIAPYDDQVNLIDQNIQTDELEVKTVDGFQGREKETILISMTRSNIEGIIGFLKDKRRFNVALTRARRKVIVIGDGSTLREDSLYRDFISFAENNGKHILLEE